MPVKHKFLDDGRGVLLEGKGHLTGQELIEALSEIHASEIYQKQAIYSIIDFTLLESTGVSTEEIRIIVHKHKSAARLNPDRVVVLAASKNIAFGLSRMWQANLDEIKWDVSIVRSLEEAKLLVKKKVKDNFNIDITSM